MINNEKRELTLIYNSDKHDDKKARGYVESLQGFSIKTLDLAKETLTETQLAQIAGKMQLGIQDLLDTTYDNNVKHNTGLKDLDDAELLTLLKNDRKLIYTPILIGESKAYKIGTGYEFIKEDMVREVAGLRHANREEQRGVDVKNTHGT